MDYKTETETSMKAYPSLYLCEEDVLHHLFFTNGNGYDWINGELVSLGEKSLTPNEIIQNAHDYKRRYYQYCLEDNTELGREMHDYWKEKLERLDSPNYIEEERTREIEFRKNVEEWEKDDLDKIYPLCEYSKLCCLPDDIKSDWLTAAEKAYEYAFSLTRTECDNRWLKRAKQRIIILLAGEKKGKKQ